LYYKGVLLQARVQHIRINFKIKQFFLLPYPSCPVSLLIFKGGWVQKKRYCS